MKTLVTGQNGFIGKHLSKALAAAGHKVIPADISTGTDICELDQLKALEAPDLVIHLANLSFVPASYNSPETFYRVNCLGTLNVLELCRRHSVHVIYLSSYVYGNPQYQPIDEKHPVQPFNPYAQSKAICESLCEGYSRDFGLGVTIFRPFNVYGPGQNPEFLIPTLIRQASKGRIEVKTDKPRRDFVYIGDVVDAIILSVERRSSANDRAIYNLGSGVSTSVREVAQCVIGQMNQTVEYCCKEEPRQSEVLDTVADITRARRDLDWKPVVGLEAGIRATIIGST